MDALHWNRLEDIFHRAADVPLEEQAKFIALECGGDAELQAQLLDLVAKDRMASVLVDSDLSEAAAGLFETGIAGADWASLDFSPYKVLRVLGEGGMRTVFLAERPDLLSLVAIKVLRDAHLSPARFERFAAEQRILSQLNHPNIGRLYDARTLHDGTPYFVMEYVDGVPLTHFCRTEKSSITRRLELFRAVCEAVQYAHAHALIHRDLKPSNILVKSDGSIRLLDFGIAK